MRIYPRQLPGLLCFLLTIAFCIPAWGETTVPDADTLLKKVASRMGAEGFSAHFFQESPLQAIGVVETAEGEVWFRRPSQVRWEYQSPDRIHYITNGKTLWIHSLDDGQVWTGSANAFFGQGGGARFLTDVASVTQRFNPAPPVPDNGNYRLVLTPKKTGDILSRVELTIDATTFDITRVLSKARTGEETTLTFSAFERKMPDASRFVFEIPKGSVVSPLE